MDALSEIEPVSFPEPVGELEAFHTGGGISTMPFSWEGKVEEMEYKTLRYPGHVAIMRPIRQLGLLSNEPILVKGQPVVPRDLFIAAATPTLRKPDGHDLVALRVVVSGTRNGNRCQHHVRPARLVRPGAPDQRDDADHRVFPLAHGAAAGGRDVHREACSRRTRRFRSASTWTGWRSTG